MNFFMKKHIVFVDTETTGLSPLTDRILQIAAVKVNEEFDIIDSMNFYIRPSGEYQISESAHAVHGLTEEFIEANGKDFNDVAPKFLDFIKDCDVAGYNSNSFDWKFIYCELQRVGLDLDMDDKVFYDVFLMEKRLNPSNLDAVFKKYTGNTMEEYGYHPHDALSDVKATAVVMQHQMKEIHKLHEDITQWTENQLLSPEGSVRNAGRPDNPRIVFAVGKYKDRDVYDVVNEDPGYCKWWSQKVATRHSLKIVKEYCIKRQTK